MLNRIEADGQSNAFPFVREKRFSVAYEGNEIGYFDADLVIANLLIIELKSVESLAVPHSVQLVNYLAVAKLERGLLLNFGAKSLEFKTKTRSHSSSPQPSFR